MRVVLAGWVTDQRVCVCARQGWQPVVAQPPLAQLTQPRGSLNATQDAARTRTQHPLNKAAAGGDHCVQGAPPRSSLQVVAPFPLLALNPPTAAAARPPRPLLAHPQHARAAAMHHSASSAAPAPPPLQALSAQLQPLGLAHLADAHVLHPGQRREQLLRALLTRLLGGASVDAISTSSAEALEGLAQDERFAEKCHTLLQLLGISATPEQLRGCSASQEQSTAPLLAMAQLLQGMERQQQQASSSSRPDAPAPAGSHALRVTQLLSCAAANLSKLTADSIQLFPSDMADTLRAYSDQGALMHLPQLCQQAASRVQQLQQQLQAMLGAGGGASCEAAGSAAWQGLVGEVTGALDRLLSDVAAFDAMYEQELSVWASAKGQQPCSPAPGSAGSQPAAEAMGRMARSLVAGYQELTGVMAAFEAIRSQHTALKDVPVASLQELRLQLADTRQHFRIAADATAIAAGVGPGL